MSPRESARARRRQFTRNGIPVPQKPDDPLPKQIITTPRFWLFVVALMIDAVCLTLLYFQIVPDRQVPGGTLVGLGNEAVPIALRYAAFSVIPLTILFVWVDRFRPQRFFIWLVTFGWGACVATYLAANINSWAAAHLSILGDGDPASAARAAIYVAPWVEEACKGTIVFWLAILMRYQIVSRISGVVLAGLSASAFAFVENALYYGRIYREAARTYGAAEPMTYVQQLFFQRGVLTCFAHPLFTSMTGMGLAIALRSKSKVVRVVAPLAGYTLAALLHMTFNTTVTFVQGPTLIFMYVMALSLVAGVVIFVLRGLLAQGRLIRSRLGDYVRMGWLPDTDPLAFSRMRTRYRALWQSLFTGFQGWWDTVRIQRSATELAYLRDSIVRGIVDQGGLQREKDLFAKIRQLRFRAVVVPAARASYPDLRGRLRRNRPASGYAAPSYPGPAGIGGSWPAPSAGGWAPPPGPSWAPPAAAPGAAPLGPAATKFSEVNPTWGPPAG
ncbi:MAG: PrsW family intramembrane metalloprotease [Propionibacteriaceae bacterium]